MFILRDLLCNIIKQYLAIQKYNSCLLFQILVPFMTICCLLNQGIGFKHVRSHTQCQAVPQIDVNNVNKHVLCTV